MRAMRRPFVLGTERPAARLSLIHILWEGETLAAGEVLARLQAMGLDTGTAAEQGGTAGLHALCNAQSLLLSLIHI